MQINKRGNTTRSKSNKKRTHKQRDANARRRVYVKKSEPEVIQRNRLKS